VSCRKSFDFVRLSFSKTDPTPHRCTNHGYSYVASRVLSTTHVEDVASSMSVGVRHCELCAIDLSELPSRSTVG